MQAQQFGTVLYAARTLPDVRGKTVAVIGQGSAGLWFNFALQQRGAAKIIALDLKAYRLRHSQDFGATHTIHNAEGSAAEALREINGGDLPDVVIEAAGEPESINLAVEIARLGWLRALFWRAAPGADGVSHFRSLLEDADDALDGGHDQRPGPCQHASGAGIHQQRRGQCGAHDHAYLSL